MNEGSSDDRLPYVDVRRNTGIDRSPLGEIKTIQTLLADVYRDAGDGRTLFRELVQNADDAGARQLRLIVLERGWPDAENSLLRGPALLVVNNGAFPGKDREALHKAVGGSKEDDVAKVGTFGIGLKSVFHFCEAFLYMGIEKSKWRAGVLNPWAGTGDAVGSDPLHLDWDVVDVKRLRPVTTKLLGQTSNGLLLWIPLRRRCHLDRGAEGRQYGLGEHCPKPDDLCDWFCRSVPAAMLLAQSGHLRTIDLARAPNPEGLSEQSEKLMHVCRQEVGWVGRHRDDTNGFSARPFKGEIISGDQSWVIVGIEALGSESLRQLRSRPDWPPSSRLTHGRISTVPRKALAHAAVTVMRPSTPEYKLSGTRLRWAAFLPLDDDPEPGSSAIVESRGSSSAWEIILHGYFWPSHDRRSIPGVTGNTGRAVRDSDMRIRWNRALRDDLLLPLLPSVIANAVDKADEYAARELLDAVVHSDMVKNYGVSVTQRHWLLPIVDADGVRWKALDADSCSILSIPRWSLAPEVVRQGFTASCRESTDDVAFIDNDSPRLAGSALDDWPDDCLERLLSSIPVDVFGSAQSLRWIEGFVRHVLGPVACAEDNRTVTVARWLVDRIGNGALTHTTRRTVSRESRDELRNAWRDLCRALPKTWLVETPVDSRQAVAELAAKEVIGEGLFPVPVGRQRDEPSCPSQLNQKRLDRALSVLGRQLQAGGESQRLRHSRLLLAEVLLSRREDRPTGELEELPLLRATRLPDGREEAWSVAKLCRRNKGHRVFARPVLEESDYSTDTARPRRRSDWKRAVTELAKALNEPVWLVSREAVSSVADVPSPTCESLASAVLCADAFSGPTHRKPLLMRIAADVSDGDVRQAARALLAGRAASIVGEDAILFHDRTGNKMLRILLRLLNRSWCAVQAKMLESLPQEVLDALSVRQVDHQALHCLLGECLGKSVNWPGLSDEEALLLLEQLYSATSEEYERWCMMPLHRGIDGVRGTLDHRARRSTGMTGDCGLPPELEAKVRLLDPDPQVANLYGSLPSMDRDGVLRAMLEDSSPWHFAQRIVQCVRPADGPITLPADSELRDLLRHRCWLPHRESEGLAPDAVLVAPEEVLQTAADLAAAEAFGDQRLPEAVDPRVWRTAGPIVREVLGRPGRERQMQRLVDALDSARVAQVDGGAWLVMPDPGLVDGPLIEDALATILVVNHPGWKFVHTVAQSLQRGADSSGFPMRTSQLLCELAQVLCAWVPPNRQLEMLTSLAASRPARDSPGGRLFRSLLAGFAKTDGFSADVLPNLDLPTQDGNWHASRDVARTETGVAKRHLLIPELRVHLRLSCDDLVPLAGKTASGWSGARLDILEKYFDPWRDRVPHGAVGAFLTWLGDGLDGTIRELAQQWLGEDVAIEPIEGLDQVNVFVSPQIARGNRVRAVNVLGWRVEMEAEADTLLAEDPVPFRLVKLRGRPPFGPGWEITLRDVEPQSRSSSELMRLLGDTVERWAVGCLGLDREGVKARWSRTGEASQSQTEFRPVLASIRAHLPLTLRQLDVQQNKPLHDALRKAERTQRKREQAPSRKRLENEREALEHLATLIVEHQPFLWGRVNEVMRRYGYAPDSTLLELAQNADDALAQAAEIKGGPIPRAIRRLKIQVNETDGTSTVDILHWGRRINDTGGTAFPAGRERQWDQDLYFMMLMNLSAKPGETADRWSSSATTGRFGLGFKSVHLVSASPSVVSGFIAFSIAGGLLPQEQAVSDEVESQAIAGRRPTRIRLPLRSDVEGPILIQELFRRFAHARALLPVFARQVREVVVEGGPVPGVHVFDGKPVDGASGWSVGIETELPNHDGCWRILRFRPADADAKNMGTAALAIGLREGVPTAFGPDIPFLWNVTPTSESWGCGYAVNGPIKLDPGRTHVSLDDETTLQVARDLGATLGKGLIELHNVLDGRTDRTLWPWVGGDGRGFLSALWRVLAAGMTSPDELRRAFLLELHGNGRGLSAWMAAKPAVPSGLPAPFQTLLPPLTSEMVVEVASDGLDHRLCSVLAQIEDKDLVALLDGRHVVSAEVAQLLRPLCKVAGTNEDVTESTRFGPSDLFAELAERWDHFLTPDRLHGLRPLAEDGASNFAACDPQGVTWRSTLTAHAADGSPQPLRNLLLRDAPAYWVIDADGRDELLRAAFAPDDRVLHPAYIKHSTDCQVFRWLRAQHRVDAATMAEWCGALPEDLRSAAIRYLLYGELRVGVLQHLVPIKGRPRWLQDHSDASQLVEAGCDESWRRQSLLGALFPDRFRAADPLPESRPDSTGCHADTFFQQLLVWWDDDDIRDEVVSAYEEAAWPAWLRRDGIAEGLRMGSDDHWLALLVLGACQGLGRTQANQHRRFLEWAHEGEWWDVFKTPGEPDAWMKELRYWQDSAEAKLDYPQWMSLFPAIYQFTRYLDVYVRLLKSASERSSNTYIVDHLFAPRVDETLTGTGTHFDAPPAPLGMGRHWVLRELVRMEVVGGDHLFPDCWVPSVQVLNVLRPFGLELDEGRANSEKAHAIFDFMASELGTDTPNLHLAFDIPLRHLASNPDMGLGLGLEQ